MIRNLKYLAFVFFCVQCKEPANINAEKKESVREADSTTKKHNKEKPFSQDEIVDLYTYAIETYLNSRTEKFKIDSLFIGSGENFVNVVLPKAIANIPIVQIDPVQANSRYHHPSVFLNVVAWPDKKRTEFIVITFFEGGKPQHNFHLFLNEYVKSHELTIDTAWFEYAYGK